LSRSRASTATAFSSSLVSGTARAGEVVEVEREPSGQARDVAQRGEELGPQRGRAPREQRAHQVALTSTMSENTAWAERP
jgi:hypothetical protein